MNGMRLCAHSINDVSEPNKSGRNKGDAACTAHSGAYLILYYMLEAIYVSC